MSERARIDVGMGGCVRERRIGGEDFCKLVQGWMSPSRLPLSTCCHRGWVIMCRCSLLDRQGQSDCACT